MKCAFVIPTANPFQCGQCFAAWRNMGWDTIALANGPAFEQPIANATRIIHEESYRGWGNSFNHLAALLAGEYDWLATGGDDCWPDPNIPAPAIGAWLSYHFRGTMGVCQPSKDRWAFDKNGTGDPICYAPIIGADFARRWNGGRGAFWPGYGHFFADNELYETAKASGLLLERPDWHHHHRHWSKLGEDQPSYMRRVSDTKWATDEAVYRLRRESRFPGHQPLEA